RAATGRPGPPAWATSPTRCSWTTTPPGAPTTAPTPWRCPASCSPTAPSAAKGPPWSTSPRPSWARSAWTSRRRWSGRTSFPRRGTTMAKVNIDNGLFERAQRAAAAAGYSSVEEFVAHCVENELKKLEVDKAEGQVADQLRGLGYIE